MAVIRRTASEIADQENEAAVLASEGKTNVPGMSYEEGVSAALQWVLGDSDDAPMEV